MDIVIAAEKPSIATLPSEHTRSPVAPGDIRVTENPNETGSFYIGYAARRYLMSPDGTIRRQTIRAFRPQQ